MPNSNNISHIQAATQESPLTMDPFTGKKIDYHFTIVRNLLQDTIVSGIQHKINFFKSTIILSKNAIVNSP